MNRSYLLKNSYAFSCLGLCYAGHECGCSANRHVLKKIRKLGMQLQEFLEQCEQIVRDVLKLYLRRVAKGLSVKDINKDPEAHITYALEAQMSLTDVVGGRVEADRKTTISGQASSQVD